MSDAQQDHISRPDSLLHQFRFPTRLSAFGRSSFQTLVPILGILTKANAILISPLPGRFHNPFDWQSIVSVFAALKDCFTILPLLLTFPRFIISKVRVFHGSLCQPYKGCVHKSPKLWDSAFVKLQQTEAILIGNMNWLGCRVKLPLLSQFSQNLL